MKIVIEGTIDECAEAIHKLSGVLPCVAVSTDRHALSAEFIQPQHGPCPHSRPNWQMCPHCNGTNEAARTGYPAAELVYLPTSTSAPAVGAGPSTNVIEGACPHRYVTAKGTCRACYAQVSRA